MENTPEMFPPSSRGDSEGNLGKAKRDVRLFRLIMKNHDRMRVLIMGNVREDVIGCVTTLKYGKCLGGKFILNIVINYLIKM